MILCQKTKFDQKNRVLVPREYIKLAGGEENGVCYITYDEDTKEIKVIIKETPKNEESIKLLGGKNGKDSV